MDQESIHINSDRKETDREDSINTEQKETEPKSASASDGMSSESILLIVALILLFIALNVWGYYLYKRGFFGATADIKQSPAPAASSGAQKKVSIFMLPNVN